MRVPGLAQGEKGKVSLKHKSNADLKGSGLARQPTAKLSFCSAAEQKALVMTIDKGETSIPLIVKSFTDITCSTSEAMSVFKVYFTVCLEWDQCCSE